MLGVPVDKRGVNSKLRQKGRIAVLACGYQGRVGALKAMGRCTWGSLNLGSSRWSMCGGSQPQRCAAVDRHQRVIEMISTRQPSSVGALTFTVKPRDHVHPSAIWASPGL